LSVSPFLRANPVQVSASGALTLIFTSTLA
jgi:hypothetical protein